MNATPETTADADDARPTPEQYFNAARELYGSDEIEIDADEDDPACLSENDEGAWVRAWVYVTDAEASGEETGT